MTYYGTRSTASKCSVQYQRAPLRRGRTARARACPVQLRGLFGRRFGRDPKQGGGGGRDKKLCARHVIQLILNLRFLNSASYDVASDISRRVIQRIVNTGALSSTASYDVASNICQAVEAAQVEIESKL